jgi:hypothetical protein
MDADVATLAASGANTLLGLMVADGWGEVKEKFAQLLGRRRGDVRAVAGELEAARTQVAEARERGDGAAEEDAAAEWRSRLRRLLAEDQEAAVLLAQLIEQYAAQVTKPSTSTEIHHNTFHGPVAVNSGSGDQTNTFGVPDS